MSRYNEKYPHILKVRYKQGFVEINKCIEQRKKQVKTKAPINAISKSIVYLKDVLIQGYSHVMIVGVERCIINEQLYKN